MNTQSPWEWSSSPFSLFETFLKARWIFLIGSVNYGRAKRGFLIGVRKLRVGIFKPFKETRNRFRATARQSPYFKTFMEPRNRIQGMNSASLCSLAGRYDNPIPTRFLAPIDCLKIPTQAIHTLAESIPQNWFLGSVKVNKYRLWLHSLAESIPWNRFLGSLKV